MSGGILFAQTRLKSYRQLAAAGVLFPAAIATKSGSDFTARSLAFALKGMEAKGEATARAGRARSGPSGPWIHSQKRPIGGKCIMTIADVLTEKHSPLYHTEDKTVVSHTQRDEGDWIQHTLMLENCDAPFRFKRPQKYRSLKGARVSVDYYPQTTIVAGFEMETMKVVRIRRC